MKRLLSILTTLALSVASSPSLKAQTLLIKDLMGNTVNEQTVVANGNADETVIEHDLHVVNNAGEEKEIGCKRYELSVLSGTQNYFCWALCYLPVDAGSIPVWDAPDSYTMSVDEQYEGFHSYHRPEDISGVSTYRFVWYDIDDDRDSVWVDVAFDITTGIEAHEKHYTFSVSPNPAVDYLNVTSNFHQQFEDVQLSIYNMLGEQVQVAPLEVSGENNLQIDLTALQSGVYFYSLIANGQQLLTTKRLVVTD